MNLETMTMETFAPLEGTRFELQEGGEEPVHLTLDQVVDLGSVGRSGASRTPFSLLFRGPSGIGLEQGMYRVSHEALGDLDLFLVPMQPDEHGPLFEAVFS